MLLPLLLLVLLLLLMLLLFFCCSLLLLVAATAALSFRSCCYADFSYCSHSTFFIPTLIGLPLLFYSL